MKARLALALVLLAPAAAADVTPIRPLPQPLKPPVVVVKPPSCTLTYTGAVSATFPCTATALYDQKSNRGTVAITPSSPQAGQVVTTVWAPGELKVGTLAGTTTGVGYSAVYQQTAQSPTSWAATNQGAALGSLSATITSVTTTTIFTGGHAYAVHGSINATLPAVAGSGASGNVTMSATF